MVQLTEIVKAQLVFYDARCDERHRTRLTDEDYDDEAEEKMTEEEEFENENIRQVSCNFVATLDCLCFDYMSLLQL
jgi:hypothetical protein